MEEKKDRTTEGNIPQQGEDLSEQDKEILEMCIRDRTKSRARHPRR